MAQHAIIIGIDGLAVSSLHAALRQGYAPTLAALRRRGAYTDDARVTQPSSSLVNWASTLFAVPPAFHGVHDFLKAFGASPHQIRPATLRAADAVWPNVFSVARQARPGMGTAAYHSWPPLEQILQPRRVLNHSILLPCENCDACRAVEPELVRAFGDAMEAEKFALSWLYLDVLDECAHVHGATWSRYLHLIREVDGWIASVLAALRRAALLEVRWLAFELAAFQHSAMSRRAPRSSGRTRSSC